MGRPHCMPALSNICWKCQPPPLFNNLQHHRATELYQLRVRIFQLRGPWLDESISEVSISTPDAPCIWVKKNVSIHIKSLTWINAGKGDDFPQMNHHFQVYREFPGFDPVEYRLPSFCTQLFFFSKWIVRLPRFFCWLVVSTPSRKY